MGTKINSNYSDLLTFTRASKGHALRPVSYGDDLFDSDTSNWSRGVFSVDGTLVYSANQLTHTLGSGDTSGARWVLPITCVVGEVLRLTVDSVAIGNGATSGGIGITANSNGSGYSDDVSISAGGTEVRVPATATTMYLTITTSGSSGATTTVTNVTVKKAIFDQPDGTLTLFEHPDNVPRVEWDADRNRLGLLVEESRTNLVTYSEDFSNAYWPKADVTVSASSEVDPSGGTNAYELVESATTANHLLNKTGVVGANTYSEFIFAKANTRSWIRLQSQSPSNSWINVNLSTGEKGLSGGGENSSSVEDFGNGWYKISLNFTATTTTGPQIFVLDSDRGGASPSYLGDGTSSILIYGAQLEAGSFPTSYIKTTGSTTTRSADVASIPVADFGYNQSAGTLYAEFDVNTLSDQINGGVVVLIADAGDNRIRINTVSDNIRGQIRKDASNSFSVSVSGYGSSTGEKVALAFKENDAAFVISGATLDTDSSVAIPRIETLQVAGNSFCGHLKSTKYYPRRLTNAQLQDLTS